MELFTNNYTNHDVVGVIVFSSIMICVAAFMTGLTIYVYRSVPDPVNDIEHGVVHSFMKRTLVIHETDRYHPLDLPPCINQVFTEMLVMLVTPLLTTLM